ncbi:MAG: penicillin-binding protein 1C [Gemmatimonadetes bacterium]|nr:penicillin-binding protein 1C [Gemmatimonadota bacterium]
MGDTVALLGAGALAAALALAGWIAWPLPADVARPAPVPALVLEDRNGLVLRATRAADGSRGGWVPLAEVDPKILQAFLAAEDRRFYDHHGIDLRAALRAFAANVRAGRVVSGASTLTMQTARLLRPTGRGWLGKARQALWALRLEAHLPKSAILELYLNRVPLGQGAVGVSAAAAVYLDGSPRSVSLGQAALLASLARAPSRDNPLVSAARARARRDAVLRRMVEVGYARPEDARRARTEPVAVRPPRTPFLAPHFTTRALAWAEAEGAPMVGRVRTTLDLELQTELEGEVRHTVGMLKDRGGRQAAVVVLDNRTGGVLAWVGSPDFWTPEAGQVDMVVSPRQPGSALKPFLYALAFDHGYTAASVLPDVPHVYATALGPYRPQNYDRRYHGPVRIREALGSSFNVPAVEMADRLGVAALLNTLRGAGFASLDRPAEHYGLGLALGNGDVTLLELANAYRALAAGGVWRPVRWRLDDGAEHSSRPVPERRFVSERAAVLVTDILADPVARVPGFGVETAFDFPFPVAAKTGTSRHFTDNWAVGTTGGFTVAVWVGDFSGRPMQGVSGISGAGPLLYRAILRTARRFPVGRLRTPEEAGLRPLAICRLSGLRATPDCPSMVEWFVPGTEPTASGDWREDGRIVWPAEYAEWASAGAGEWEKGGEAADSAVARFSTPPLHHSAFRIVSIEDGDRYQVPVGVAPRYATLPLRAAGGAAERGVRWFVDGRETRDARWRLVPGEHTIRAVSAAGESAEVRIAVDP